MSQPEDDLRSLLEDIDFAGDPLPVNKDPSIVPLDDIEDSTINLDNLVNTGSAIVKSLYELSPTQLFEKLSVGFSDVSEVALDSSDLSLIPFNFQNFLARHDIDIKDPAIKELVRYHQANGINRNGTIDSARAYIQFFTERLSISYYMYPNMHSEAINCCEYLILDLDRDILLHASLIRNNSSVIVASNSKITRYEAKEFIQGYLKTFFGPLSDNLLH